MRLYWDLGTGTAGEAGWMALGTAVMDREGTAYRRRGKRRRRALLEGTILVWPVPQGIKCLPPNKVFPQIRPAWTWPAPCHQHTLSIPILPEGRRQVGT